MKVRLDDGTALFYRVDDFTDPWRDPETVVLNHGMAKNHKLWYGWVPILARHYRVVRYDMRGMGQSSVPEPGYPLPLDTFANDVLGLLDKLRLQKVHLIGESAGGSISMRFATLHQERLLSLTVCTSPTYFMDPQRLASADRLDREGVAPYAESTMTLRLDPNVCDSAHIGWYTAQMAATPGHVVSSFRRNVAGFDLRPLLRNVRTPTLVLAAANLGERGKVPRGYHEAAGLFPNGRLVLFPNVSGLVQHMAPEQCARVWLDFARGLHP